MTPEQVREAYSLLQKRDEIILIKSKIMANKSTRLPFLDLTASNVSINLCLQSEIDIIENDLLNLGVVCV